MMRTFTLQLYDRIESDPRCSSRYQLGNAGASIVRCQLQDGHDHAHDHFCGIHGGTRYKWHDDQELKP